MSEQLSTTSTKGVLPTSIFDCSKCGLLLETPVIIIEEVGNICNPCYLKNAVEWTYNHKCFSPALDAVLTNLSFPCKFTSCNQILSYVDLKPHEKSCIFRSIECLFSNAECVWKGTLLEFSQHLISAHPTHVVDVNDETDEFTFEINLTKFNTANFSTIKLLKNTHNSSFLVKIKRDGDTDSLVYTFYEKKVRETYNNKSKIGNNVQLQHVYQNTKYEASCEILPLNEITTETISIRIRLDTLKEVNASNENMTVVIKKNDNSEPTLSDIFGFFECPVCKVIMNSPIYICNGGHSVCGDCKINLSSCPVCRSAMSSIRNYMLESVTEKIRYNCIYNCGLKYYGNEIKDHYLICAFRPFTCPVDKNQPGACTFVGKYSEFSTHFKVKHPNSVITSNSYKDMLHLVSHSSTVFKYIFNQKKDNLYRLMINQSHNKCHLSMKILKYQEAKAYYVFEFETVNVAKELRIVRSELCTKTEDEKEECISFKFGTLAPFKNNDGQVKYSIQFKEYFDSD